MIRNNALFRGRENGLLNRIRGDSQPEEVASSLSLKLHELHRELVDPRGAGTIKGRLNEIYERVKPGKSAAFDDPFAHSNESYRFTREFGDRLESYAKTLLEVRTDVRALQTTMASENTAAAEFRRLHQTRHGDSERLLQGHSAKLDTLVAEAAALREQMDSAKRDMIAELERRLWLPSEASLPDLSQALETVYRRLASNMESLSAAHLIVGLEFVNQCSRECEGLRKCLPVLEQRDWSQSEALRAFVDPSRRIQLCDVEPMALGLCGESEQILQHLRGRLTDAFARTDLHIVRPIPGLTRFDAQVHEAVPTMNRTAPRAELSDIVCERAQSGWYVGEGANARVLQRAVVGRYVLDSQTRPEPYTRQSAAEVQHQRSPSTANAELVTPAVGGAEKEPPESAAGDDNVGGDIRDETSSKLASLRPKPLDTQR